MCRLTGLGFGLSNFLSSKRANRLLNIVRCESHHEALVQILADYAINYKE